MKLKFIPDGSIVTDVNNDRYYRVVREDGYIRLNSVVWEDNDWEDADEIRDVGESLDMEVERMDLMYPIGTVVLYNSELYRVERILCEGVYFLGNNVNFCDMVSHNQIEGEIR